MKSLEQDLALREAMKHMTPVERNDIRKEQQIIHNIIFAEYDDIPQDERPEVVVDDYNVMTGRKVL